MSDIFWGRGYELVEGLIDASQLAMASAAIETQSRTGAMSECRSPIVSNALDQYSPVPGALLLTHCKPGIEALIGRELLEGYAFWRKYLHGATLGAHVDRAACEISATVTIGTEPTDAEWLFHVEDLHGNHAAIAIPPGAGVIYQGHKVKHWREKLDAVSHKQMFLHYVLKDGPFADHVFDKAGATPVESTPL